MNEIQKTNQNYQEMIPIHLLESSPHNSYEIGSTESLEASIKLVGLLSPLTVTGPNNQGKYTVLSGNRRLQACQHLNRFENDNTYSMIPCNIITNQLSDVFTDEEDIDLETNESDSDLDTKKAIEKLTIEIGNLEVRDDFNRDEHCLNLITLLKEISDGKQAKRAGIIKQFCDILKVSPRYGRIYMTVFEQDNLKQLVLDKKMSINDAYEITQQEEDKQQDVIKQIKEGANVKSVLKNLRQEKAANSENHQPDLQHDVSKKNTNFNPNVTTTAKTHDSNPNFKDSNIDSISNPKTLDSNPNTVGTSTQKESNDGYLLREDAILEKMIEEDDDDLDFETAKAQFYSFDCPTASHMDSVGGLIKGLEREEKKSGMADIVIKWCEKMKTKKNYSEKDYEALEACKSLIEFIGF